MYNKPGSTRKRAPAADERVTITKCPTVAAGLPAIYQTVRFGLREMGPVRAFKTLLAVNKKKGFDCQSNVLVPISSVADRSNMPTSKFVVISVAPAADAEAAAEDIRLAARRAV